MAEKLIFALKEKQQQKQSETKTVESNSIAEEKTDVKFENNVNPFSANAFKDAKQDFPKVEKNIEAKQSSSIIDTPNYDFMETLTEEEHKQIFKEEEKIEIFEKNERKRKWKLKNIVFSILFAILGVWGLINISTIDSLNSEIATVTETYNVNLVNYLKNLTAIDTTNQQNMKNLFEVIPNQNLLPTKIAESSNWFDRFCNFLAGLFGG